MIRWLIGMVGLMVLLAVATLVWMQPLLLRGNTIGGWLEAYAQGGMSERQFTEILREGPSDRVVAALIHELNREPKPPATWALLQAWWFRRPPPPPFDRSYAATYALRLLGPGAEPAIPALLEVIRHPATPVHRMLALEAIGKIARQAETCMPVILSCVRYEKFAALEALRGFPSEARTRFSDWADLAGPAEAPSIRLQALALMRHAEVPLPDRLPWLLLATTPSEPNWNELQDGCLIEVLGQLATYSDDELKAHAVPFLQEMVADSEPPRATAHANDPKPIKARAMAAGLLVRLGLETPKYIELLQQIAAPPPRTPDAIIDLRQHAEMWEARIALWKHDPARSPLEESLQLHLSREDSVERLAAARAFVRAFPERAGEVIPVLTEIIRSQHYFLGPEAIALFIEIGPRAKSALPFLRNSHDTGPFQNDPRLQMAISAIEAP
jgi:hypothetical protein